MSETLHGVAPVPRLIVPIPIAGFSVTWPWSNLAAAGGEAAAAENKDQAAALMTPADLSEAQRRARVGFASDYRDCD